MLIVDSKLLIKRSVNLVYVPRNANAGSSVTRKARFLQFRHVWKRDKLGKPGIGYHSIANRETRSTCANR